MKVHKKKRDNRGLTLIELIVAVAISAIAIGGIWQFVLISTRSYESQKAESELQQEVQQTMNQVQNLLIDTDKAVAYFYQRGTEEVEGVEKITYAQLNTDYDEPIDNSKRLEVYNNDTVAHLEWDKETQNVVYKETAVANADSEQPSDWDSAVLAEGVETMAIDLSQVEDNQVLKVKMTFNRNDKTYTATRSIAMRNDIINTGDVNDIYGNDVAVKKPLITIEPVMGDKLKPRAKHDFNAEIKNTDEETLLWTIQGQTSDDTSINITTGEIVIGATETPGTIITVIATLETDRTVNGIYRFRVDNPDPPTVLIVDERTGACDATGELNMAALCGEAYMIPIRADVNPAEYSHKWSFIPLNNNTTVEAEIYAERLADGTIQEYLIVGESQMVPFQLRCDVVSNEQNNGYDTAYINVIPPVPTIKLQYAQTTNANGVLTTTNVITYEDVTLSGGTDLIICDEWALASSEDDFGYQASDILNQHDLRWTIVLEKNGTTIETIVIDKHKAGTDLSKTIPLLAADKMTISAVSLKYPGVQFPVRTVTITPAQLSLTAYHGAASGEPGYGEAYTAQELAEVPLNQEIQFVPDYIGGKLNNLIWTLTRTDLTLDENGKEIVTNVDFTITDEDISSNHTFTLNTASQQFGNLSGKDVTVTVFDYGNPSVMIASVSFTVEESKLCDKVKEDLDDLTDETILAEKNYLHPNGKGGRFDDDDDNDNISSLYESYGFNVAVNHTGNIELNDVYYIKNDNTIEKANSDNFKFIMSYVISGTNIRFTPQKYQKMYDIKAIIYDVDDVATHEHIGFIKLNVTSTDFEYQKDDKKMYLKTDRSSVKNPTKENEVIEKTFDFCNFYGADYHMSNGVNYNQQPVKYQIKYESVLSTRPENEMMPKKPNNNDEIPEFYVWKMTLNEYNASEQEYNEKLELGFSMIRN